MYMYIHKLLSLFFFFSLLNLSFLYRDLSQELKRVEGKFFFLHFKDGVTGTGGGRMVEEQTIRAETPWECRYPDGCPRRGGMGRWPAQRGMTCISAGPAGHL